MIAAAAQAVQEEERSSLGEAMNASESKMVMVKGMKVTKRT
jgi:hypothetical protein